jgi:hypothetical protein
MPSFLARLFMGLFLPELGLSQDPGLIAIGKVKPFDFIAQPKLRRSKDTTISSMCDSLLFFF